MVRIDPSSIQLSDDETEELAANVSQSHSVLLKCLPDDNDRKHNTGSRSQFAG